MKYTNNVECIVDKYYFKICMPNKIISNFRVVKFPDLYANTKLLKQNVEMTVKKYPAQSG
jgi:hypothetical protein